MSIQGTSVEILDATLCTRTLVEENFSTKPKTKQPPSEATEAEAQEGSEVVVEVDFSSFDASSSFEQADRTSPAARHTARARRPELETAEIFIALEA